MAEMNTNRIIVTENKHISAFAHLLRGIYKISGAKKAFCLSEDEIKKLLKSRTVTAACLCPPITRHIMK